MKTLCRFLVPSTAPGGPFGRPWVPIGVPLGFLCRLWASLWTRTSFSKMKSRQELHFPKWNLGFVSQICESNLWFKFVSQIRESNSWVKFVCQIRVSNSWVKFVSQIRGSNSWVKFASLLQLLLLLLSMGLLLLVLLWGATQSSNPEEVYMFTQWDTMRHNERAVSRDRGLALVCLVNCSLCCAWCFSCVLFVFDYSLLKMCGWCCWAMVCW